MSNIDYKKMLILDVIKEIEEEHKDIIPQYWIEEEDNKHRINYYFFIGYENRFRGGKRYYNESYLLFKFMDYKSGIKIKFNEDITINSGIINEKKLSEDIKYRTGIKIEILRFIIDTLRTEKLKEYDTYYTSKCLIGESHDYHVDYVLEEDYEIRKGSLTLIINNIKDENIEEIQINHEEMEEALQIIKKKYLRNKKRITKKLKVMNDWITRCNNAIREYEEMIL